MSNQSRKQASIRAVTGTVLTFEGDWHALFDNDGIAAGNFNERLLLWLEGKTGQTGLTVDGQKAAFAISEGVSSWDSLGTFDASGAAAVEFELEDDQIFELEDGQTFQLEG